MSDLCKRFMTFELALDDHDMRDDHRGPLVDVQQHEANCQWAGWSVQFEFPHRRGARCLHYEMPISGIEELGTFMAALRSPLTRAAVVNGSVVTDCDGKLVIL